MKEIIFSLTLLLFVVKSFGQTTTSPALTKDYYLKKSKTQKTVGWVMLGGGVAMTAIGYAIANKRINDDPINGVLNSEGTVIVMVVGIGCALGSIPFFISSAKNARKAATLSFSAPKILLLQQNTFAFKNQPTLTLKIGL